MIDLTEYYIQLRPVKKLKREVSSGLFFSQESVHFDKKRLTNLYWLEIDINKYQFKLAFETTPKPLKDFESFENELVAGINFGSFFLSDDLQNTKVPFFNLAVSHGRIWQFPANNRPTLLTRNGSLSQFLLPANGRIKIKDRSFTWSGSYESLESDLKVFGMFDITVLKIISDCQKSRREIVKKTKFVCCESNQLLLGAIVENGKTIIGKISNQPLDLTKYIFVLRGKASMLDGLKNGMLIENIEIGQSNVDVNDDMCSASFSLGKTKSELIENLESHLICPKGGQPKPMLGGYRKSWSVVLKIKNKIIFFINDARPKVENNDGMTVFELQQILLERFDYLWACVGDSGQSSKLMLVDGNGREIYGNMHYHNLESEVPVWDGKNGRSIPVALLVYK